MKLRKLSWLSVSLAGMRKYGFIFWIFCYSLLLAVKGRLLNL